MERNITGSPAPDQPKGEDLGIRKREKRIRVQAMIPPETMEQLQATAAKYGTSVSEVACRIITKYYEE